MFYLYYSDEDNNDPMLKREMENSLLKSRPCNSQETHPGMHRCCKLMDVLFDDANSKMIHGLILRYRFKNHPFQTINTKIT